MYPFSCLQIHSADIVLVAKKKTIKSLFLVFYISTAMFFRAIWEVLFPASKIVVFVHLYWN